MGFLSLNDKVGENPGKPGRFRGLLRSVFQRTGAGFPLVTSYRETCIEWRWNLFPAEFPFMMEVRRTLFPAFFCFAVETLESIR